MASSKQGVRERRLVEEIGLLLARCRRCIWVAVSRRLEAQGKSPLVWPVLMCLVRMGPSTQRDIAAACAQHPAGVSRLLDELEEKNLVRRRRDPNDRRKVQVEVTPEGRAWFESARNEVVEALEHALRGLSSSEKVQLRDLLIKLVSVDEESQDASGCRLE